ncbi:MAG TPA: hypothetical protein VKU62_02945 [Thermoanaerobaculia bacterium]|nr:hypothetical protein [Thermoanaerobaculia bacterium]
MTWNARRILREIADADTRQRVLRAFWRHADLTTKAIATAQLAKSLHFRDETIRKMPAEKKSELLASRIAAPEFEQTLETALMQYHTHEANAMMAAFLDRWGVPHVNGSIESDDYKVPSADAVRSAVQELGYDPRAVALYLASAGVLMGGEWASATFPVVDEVLENFHHKEDEEAEA